MKKLTEQELAAIGEKAISAIREYIYALQRSDSAHDKRRAALLSGWLIKYTSMLKNEDCFDPSRNIRYSRGDIVKVDFGYNVGNEEGGVHYAVVVDAQNALKSGTVTVIPLSSKKDGKELHYTEVDIGSELHDKTSEKLKAFVQTIATTITPTITTASQSGDGVGVEPEELEVARREFEDAERLVKDASSIARELTHMKAGSIALVSQIKTISKQRIIDPVKKRNVLYGISLSGSAMDKISEKMQELFFRRK